ncbi:MAG: hypothetical protein HUU37_09355 [Bdellovibrionales bacterium]|nr:hypothetical protein [Bdellovibrionales bacterium]
MGAKKVPYQYPKKQREADEQHQPARDKQEELRRVKIQAEQVRDKLQKRVIDNPIVAKKAALILANWIQGKKKAR